ncbi:hypothetical protein GQX73_g665 [Xylaria multiplex]|uniref:Clr5 domain-containing protein n=1 Tax=Xylaria multiplex TaxID=323545 RepID=A0A7C8N0W8_9PEZI|nr:hypothetical protein GQX73_g665 [Xylaria multiplex]
MPSQQPLVMQRLLSVASSSNSLVQPNDRVVKRRRNHHTALDWESKKPTIIQLYITENKRVEDVIEILKSDFAFNTSPRRFLEETTKWGIRKNKRRDAKYVQNVQEDPGEENSAPELDDVAFGTAGFSSDLAQSDQDDYAYTSVAIILRPKDSALALRIEANQCQFVGGSFLSTPRLSINNVVPSSSAVFEVAAKGSVQDLKALFASGQANIRDHDENGWSLLHSFSFFLRHSQPEFAFSNRWRLLIAMVKKMELLLTKGVRINAKCGELNCLGNFIRSIRWVLLEDWFSLLVYAIQHGADVYCADESGVTVSQLAYTESIYMYSGCDLGSYRGDLWDAVLHASGYDISEFRAACPRRARYTQDYARKDFELLWKGREHLCPYWEDNEWPAAPKPDQGFIDPCTSSHHQDLYRYRPPMTCPFYHISPVYSGSERSVAYRDDTPHADGRKGEGCHAREIKGNEGITSQVIEGLPSPHDFPESVSSDDTEMEDFFRGVGGLFDPTMFDV